jgi:VWFA-related protein
MNRLAALLPALAIALARNLAPQSGPATGAVPDPVVRIDVNVVQVDAVVTDSSGRRVTDLQAADFEVLQDGKSQAITNLSYVSTKPAGEETPADHPAAPANLAEGEAPPPPPVLRPAEVRRTLALVVDDLGLTRESVPPVRNAIRNFLDEQMRPGDLIAIVRTSAGLGALQQFTSDKRLLYAALDIVKYGETRVGVSSFAPLARGVNGGGALNHLRDETLAVGTLGAIRFVVNAMAGLPGRKTVVLFSGNMRLSLQGSTDEMLTSAIQRLDDAAMRASVVIHAFDLHAMPGHGATAAGNTSGPFLLAKQTGGQLLHSANDLAGALRNAAEDTGAYYLIGYHPDANTFENRNGQPKFHKIEVKVNRTGFDVRSRDGFFGEPGGATQPLEHTREAELNHALQSPSTTGSIHPRLTAVFSNLPENGSLINALLSFSTNELKWSSEPGGSHKARIDVAAAAYDENGLALAPVNTTFALQFTSQDFDEALKEGIVYGLHVPVTRPGHYVMRAAVRDAATERTGSAYQRVEIPDVESGRLALSGLVLQEATYAALYTPVPFTPANAELPRAPAPRPDVTGGAARRSFRRGTLLAYGFKIINATNSASQLPGLEVQTRMFHDEEQVLSGKTRLDPEGAQSAPDPQRLMTGGRLSLGRDMKPGEYVLQVIVTDRLARSEFNTATQFMDFEIEP